MQNKRMRRIAMMTAVLAALAMLAWWAAQQRTFALGASRTAAAREQAEATDRAASPTAGAVRREPMSPRQARLPPPDRDPRFERCERDYQHVLQSRARSLAASGNVRERIGAAMLMITTARDDSLLLRRQLLAEAVEQAPRDSLAAWLRANECRSDDACDAAAAVNHLLRLEPDNAAAWLTAIAMAMDRDDLTQADALLQKAAHAERFDVHSGETAQLVADAIGPIASTPACEQAADTIATVLELDRPGTPDNMALATANAVSAMAMPPFLGFLKLCPTGRAVPPERLPACRAVYARMAASKELLSLMIGVRGMAAHAATPAERTLWGERLRSTDLMLKQGSSLLRVSHLRLVWEEGEVPVLAALLEDAGGWPASSAAMPEGAVANP